MVTASAAVAAADEPAIPEPSQFKVAEAANDFGLRLLKTLSPQAEKENLIISPISLASALAMAYNGADGKTKTAMAATLGISSLSDKELNAGYKSELSGLKSADKALQLDIANAIWPGVPLQKNFQDITLEYYSATAKNLNFRDAKGAADTINAWCDKNTHGKIPEIVSPGELNEFTALVLTNAVYFKGEWSRTFDAKLTKPRDFHLPNGEVKKTPMMAQSGDYDYLQTDDFQAVRLPYGSGRLGMYVFLPRNRDSKAAPQFLNSLDSKHWLGWTNQMRRTPGEVVLPKFEVRWGAKMNNALASIGMGVAFRDDADFSRIPQNRTPLKITAVEHKTYMKLDEKGTEAAAATAVVVGVASSALVHPHPEPFEMIIDHPFFLAITDRQTGAMLFAGVVSDPTSE